MSFTIPLAITVVLVGSFLAWLAVTSVRERREREAYFAKYGHPPRHGMGPGMELLAYLVLSFGLSFVAWVMWLVTNAYQLLSS